MQKQKTLLKVNGERNSGTGFLTRLLKSNFPEYNIKEMQKQPNNKKIIIGWKHGTPNKEINALYPEYRVINIFVVREIKSWLISCFKNPYELENKKNIEQFIKTKFKKQDRQIDSETKKPINYHDYDRDIFEIRYYKLQKIREFYENNNNNVIVPLEFLQNNTEKFLKELAKYFNLKLKKDIVAKLVHVKTKKSNITNRNYGIKFNDEQLSYINKKYNKELEDFFSKFKIK